MANKYANLIGTNLIKDEYTKINTGFDGVDADMKAVESAIENHGLEADPHDQYALDTDLATLQTEVTSHKAEKVIQKVSVTRDLTLIGTQTITTLPNKKIKGIQILILVNGTKKTFQGFWSDGLLNGTYQDATSSFAHIAANIIISQDTATNRTQGIIKNVAKGSFDIDWSILSGTGATGTVQMYFLIFYHGE